VRIFLRGLSGYLLLLAAAMTGIWFMRTRKVEALASLLVLIATVTLTFVDRWVAHRERRRELLRGLVHEVYMNLNVLDDQKLKVSPTAPPTMPAVYPRLYLGALQAVTASGAFTETRDRQLSIQLHGWLQRAHAFNDRLLAVEIRTITNPTPEEVTLWRTTLAGGAIMRDTRKSLHELAAHLVDQYARESGIARDTILFSPGEGD